MTKNKTTSNKSNAKNQKNQPSQQKKQRKPKNNNGQKITPIGKGIREGGKWLGSMFGMPGAGKAMGAGISKIFGYGDYYTPMQNTLTSSGGPPAFSALTSGFRIKHREYLTDVSSSIGFASTTYSLNPGIATTFPYLSKIAQNFETYKIHGMIFYLNTSSANAIASTNTALGVWGAVTQYDPTEAAFSTKQQCENYVGCQSSVPSNSLIHGVECKPKSNVLDQLYVRTTTVGAEDLKFYDHGKTQIFTSGSQSVSTIGELWISYDIEFFKPRLTQTDFTTLPQERYYISTCTASNIFGNSVNPLRLAGGNLGITFTSNNNVINMPASAPAGYYQINLSIQYPNTTATVGAFSVTYGGGCSAYSGLFNNNTSFHQSPSSGATSFSASVDLTFYKTAGTAGTLTFGVTQMVAQGDGSLSILPFNPLAPVNDRILSTRLNVDELELVRELLEMHRKKLDEFKHESNKTYELPADLEKKRIMNLTADDYSTISTYKKKKKNKDKEKDREAISVSDSE